MNKQAYLVVAALLFLMFISGQIWGEAADSFGILLFVAVIVVVLAATARTAKGATAPTFDVQMITGVVSNLSVAPDRMVEIVPRLGRCGYGNGFTTLAIDGRPAFMKGVANIAVGDTIAAAGLPGSQFEILALRDRNGLTAAINEPRNPFSSSDQIAVYVAIAVTLAIVVGFGFAWLAKVAYDLYWSWWRAVKRAKELIGGFGL
jgi:hypothetical protein